MCGIVGVASTEGMKNRSARLGFMKMGLDIDSWRGWESTGMALVPEGSKNPPLVYKRAINGRDFIQLNQVEKYLADIEKYSVVIGHNRAATTGRGNIVDHNAHPFQYGKITLVHNGHIRNTHDLKGAVAGAECLVDSSHVAFSMDANGEQETLEQIEGGFVFVWWNSEASTLNIARNTERPLHMAYAHKENTFYWASELTELLHLLKDVEIDEDLGIMFPKPWNWYQYSLKDLRDFVKIPFTQRQGRRAQGQSSTQTGRGHEWTDAEIAAWETRYGEDLDDMAWENPQKPISTETSTRLSKAKVDADEVEEIRQTVANQRLKDAKAHGVPTSLKRRLRAEAELKKLGLTPNALKNCRPVSWCKYKNQNNLGTMLARTISEGRLVEVLAVHEADYDKYIKVGLVLVDMVNVRNGPKNAVHVVGVISPKMEGYMERRFSRQEVSNSIVRDVEGPDGKKITKARFIELTDKGCAHCSRDLSLQEHLTITWVGTPASPVCEECAASPEVMELLGFPSSAVHIH